MTKLPHPRAAPPRPTSIGTAGRLQSEQVADFSPESVADFVGMRTHIFDRVCREHGIDVFRPFNRGCLSTPIRHPCRGQGPFRGLSLMIVFGGGCLNVWIEV